MKTFVSLAAIILLLGAGCAPAAAPETESSATSSAQGAVSGTAGTGENQPGAPDLALSLDARLAQYQAERERCVTERLKELEGTPQAGENYGAEYHCTIKVMAPKYYEKDPEGMTELCVRLYQVSGYTKEGGFYGNLTREELEKSHELGFQKGVTMDASGRVQYDEATSRGWRTTCKGLIELNLE